MKQAKCEHCGNWTDGSATHCTYCGGRLKEKYHLEREELGKIKTGIPLIEIDPADPLPKKFGKQFVRGGQLIFLGLISIVAAIASSTVH